MRREQYFFPLLRQGRFFTTVGTAPVPAPLAHNNRVPPRSPTCRWATLWICPYPILYAPLRPGTAYVCVYRPVQASGPARLQVWLNGKQKGELRPGDYLTLPSWPYYATLFNLCLTSGTTGSAGQYLIPDRAQPNYLRITFMPEAPLWQWVPPAQGQAEVQTLDRPPRREQ